MSGPNYKKAYKDMLNKNFQEFDLNDKNVEKKIGKFCFKYGFEREKVRKKIGEDGILKAWFIKDPGKQNIYELTFADFLEKIEGIENYKKLPPNSGESLFIINQEIIKKENNKDIIKKNSIKSLDFSFNFKNLNQTFYVVHKYTSEPGGAQDNQKNDVKSAIEKGKGINGEKYNDSIFLLLVCDGDYYNDKIKKEINDAIGEENNFKLISSDKISDFLNKLTKNN